MNLNMSNLTDRFMKNVDGVVFDMLTNKIGVLRDDSIFYAQKGEDGKYEMFENPIGDMSMSLPAFALATPLGQLNEGDLILDGNGKPVGWIVKVNKKSVSVLKVTGTISTLSPAKVDVLGQGQTLMVVKNLMSTTDTTQMNPMLMAMMMGDGDNDQMMKMMMMQSMMGVNAQGASPMQMNPMLMMMLMGDDKSGKGKMDKLLPLMMMQGMGGQPTDPNMQNQISPMLMAMMMSK